MYHLHHLNCCELTSTRSYSQFKHRPAVFTLTHSYSCVLAPHSLHSTKPLSTTTTFSDDEDELSKSEALLRQECYESLAVLESMMSQLEETYKQYLEIKSQTDNLNHVDVSHEEISRITEDDHNDVKSVESTQSYNEDVTLQKIQEHHEKGENTNIFVEELVSGMLEENLLYESLSLVKRVANKKLPINSHTLTQLLTKLNQHMRNGNQTKENHAMFLNSVQFLNDHGYEADKGQLSEIMKFASATENINLALASFLKLESSGSLQQHHYKFLLATCDKHLNNQPVPGIRSVELIRHYKEGIEMGVTVELKTIRRLIHLAVGLRSEDDSFVLLVRDVIRAYPEEDRDSLLVYLDDALAEDDKQKRKKGTEEQQECNEPLAVLESTMSQEKISSITEDDNLNQLDSEATLSDDIDVDVKSVGITQGHNEDVTFQKIQEHLKDEQNTDINDHVDYVVSGMLKDDLVDESLSLVQRLVDEDIPVNSPTYSRLLARLNDQMKDNHTIQNHETFLNFLKFMHSNGYEADEYQQYQILRFAAGTGNTRLAQATFEKLQQQHTSTTSHDHHYNLLLSAYSNAHQHQPCVDINKTKQVFHHFKQGIQKGVRVERKTIQRLTHYAVGLLDSSGEVEDSPSPVQLVKDVIDGFPEEQQYPHLSYLDNALIERRLRMGDVDGAWEVAQRSKFSYCRTYIRKILPLYT